MPGMKLLPHLFFFAIGGIGWTACTGSAEKKTASASREDTALTQAVIADPVNVLHPKKDSLTKIYTQAIGDYIQAVSKKNGPVTDTLFFGKHVYGQPDDFPDIELPATIGKIPVRLVEPGLGEKIQRERKTMIYSNLIGWLEKGTAQFTFITFSNGARHQFDCFLEYRYNLKNHEFVQESVRFEDYHYSPDNKLKRIAVFQDGKYTGDKRIK